MNFMALYAFVFMPILLVAIGSVATWLHLRDLKRHEHHPAE